MLSAVFEADFLGFSYGFRPGRSPHMALDALHTVIMSQRVNWVLDADILQRDNRVESASHPDRVLPHIWCRLRDSRTVRISS